MRLAIFPGKCPSCQLRSLTHQAEMARASAIRQAEINAEPVELQRAWKRFKRLQIVIMTQQIKEGLITA